MSDVQLGAIESRFADMIWEQEPVTSSALVKRAEQALGWKRTTTHTVIKRLCEKGLFVNENGTVTSRLSREQFYSKQSKQFVEDSFAGSLPAFIAAFTKSARLTPEEAAQIRKMIDQASNAEEEGGR